MRQKKSAQEVQREDGVYILKLYVADNEPNSRLARDNLKQICAEYPQGRFEIEEIDILKDHAVAMKERIFVTPTLVVASPELRATVVGNLNDRDKVISALRLRGDHGT
jgi:circadian clock protein KaiB